MNQDRESFAGQKELIDDPVKRAEQEAANAVEQFDLVLAYVQREAHPFRLTVRVINSLQEAALKGVHSLAGTFRNTSVTIRGSKHAPPDHLDVPDEVAKFCEYINTKWDESTAVHLGAFALWKLNWIHPYADGNGRTARAVSYLVMSKKLGHLLPGTPTIPEQISVDKGPYYDALEAADAGSTDTIVDVSQIERMLESLLVKQLLSRPSLPEVAAKKLGGLLENRIKNAPKILREKVFSTADVKSQLWAIGDYVVLQLGSASELEAAENRQRTCRNPFPRLLALGETPHRKHITREHKYAAVIVDEEELGDQHALLIDRDCFISVQPKHLKIKDQDPWGGAGWLYVARLGSEITSTNFPDALDLLVARHLSRFTDEK